MSTEFETLLFERTGAVAIIKLNRPDGANGLSRQMALELGQVANLCDTDPTIRAVLLTGVGRFFCAGGDVKAMATAGDGVALEIKQMADDLHRAISTFARMSAPLVIAVNGVAAGAGLSIAAVGDVVFAAESATFTAAYTAIGLSPDGSSTYFLPRVIGLRRTQELFFLNRRLTAADALDWGLVTAVVPDAEVMATALACAERLATGPVHAFGKVKRLLLETFGNGLETQMELEGRLITDSACSPHGQEGITSFVEKRSAHFA